MFYISEEMGIMQILTTVPCMGKCLFAHTVKPLYFEAHLIRIPVLFEHIVHFLMVLSS